MSEGKKEILLGDCLELMKDIPNGSIDMILCDLPYGTTAIACLKTNRQFIVMEKEPKYYEIILKRVEDFKKMPLQKSIFEAEQ
jgi:DNA modification methylase